MLFNAERAREYIAHRDSQDLSPSTMAIDCAALHEFASWGAEKRYWRAEDVLAMPTVIRPDHAPRALSDDERDRVMGLPLYGDELLLRALLYYSGAREDELLKLKLIDVRGPELDPLTRSAIVLGTLRLWGKGGRERYVDIHSELWAILGPHCAALSGKPQDWHV